MCVDVRRLLNNLTNNNIVIYLERNQAVDHEQEKSVLTAENAILQTRIEDLHYENRLTMHQISMYEQFLPTKVKPVEVGDVLQPRTNNHYLCSTPTGLRWLKVPNIIHETEVSVHLTPTNLHFF
jgi:hypothetical protein